MKKFLLLLSLFTVYCSLFSVLRAQNLVPNPSFEQYDTCPYNSDQVYFAMGWYPFIPTPDYFNACQTIVPSDMSVPYNYFGYQQAASGKGYCGFGIYSNDPSDYEQLGCQLITPLVIGTKYYVSFKVALSDFAEYGYNKIGMRFSTIPYCITLNSFNHGLCDSLPPAPIIDTAQVYCTQIITDTTNWTKISGSFIADSAYKYLMIGRMFTNAQSQLVNSEDGIWNSYYYVDDVCVSEDSLTCDPIESINEINNPNSVNIFPIPAHDQINIEWNNAINHPTEILIYNAVLSVYDIEGRLVSSINNITKNDIIINRGNLKNGLYFYKLTDNGNIIGNGKFIITEE